MMAFEIFLLTFSTAFRTPLPPYLVVSPSRSSRASCSPVLAPEGTMARARVPSARKTSASRVGLPRESRTWRPMMFGILVWLMDRGVVVRLNGRADGNRLSGRNGKIKAVRFDPLDHHLARA